jgi:hypothetical protein
MQASDSDELNAAFENLAKLRTRTGGLVLSGVSRRRLSSNPPRKKMTVRPGIGSEISIPLEPMISPRIAMTTMLEERAWNKALQSPRRDRPSRLIPE